MAIVADVGRQAEPGGRASHERLVGALAVGLRAPRRNNHVASCHPEARSRSRIHALCRHAVVLVPQAKAPRRRGEAKSKKNNRRKAQNKNRRVNQRLHKASKCISTTRQVPLAREQVAAIAVFGVRKHRIAGAHWVGHHHAKRDPRHFVVKSLIVCHWVIWLCFASARARWRREYRGCL